MQFKRGDTFDFSGPVTVTQDGAPVTDFTGWSAISQIRDLEDVLIDDVTVTWVSRAPGVIRLQVADTSDWPVSRRPVSKVQIDVEFTSPDGVKISTSTQTITIEGDVSR